MFIQIIQALIAIPKIGEYIRQLIAAFTAYQNEQKRKELEEAVIDINAASSKEERKDAIKRFADIVSR